ncbi:TPA: phage tail protein [Streptococcus suis]
MEIFKLFGSIGLKNKEANQAIDETTGKARTAGDKIKDTFGKVATFLGTVFAGKAIFDFGKSVVEAAATAKAVQAQFDQVFEGIRDVAENKLNDLAKTIGAVPSRIKPAFNQIASFAKVAGMDASQSLEFTTRATEAAADSAAFYDKSLEETTETLKSYLKGNFNVADNLGILSTETTRNAKATELFGQKYKDLDGIQQQEVLLRMFEDANKVSGAMGQAARESDGFENVMGNLKQTWEDFKVLVGGPLLQPVVAGLQLATKWIQDLGGKFQEFEPKITLFKELIVSVYDVIFGSLSVKDNVDLLVKLGMDEESANAILSTASLIGAALTSFYDIIFGSLSKKDNIDFMAQMGVDEATATTIVNFANTIRTGFEGVWSTVQTLFGQVPSFFSSIIGALGPIITTIMDGISKMDFSGIQTLIESVLPAVQAGFQTFMSIVSPAIDSVVQSFVSMWNAAQPLIDILSGALMPVFQILGSFLGGVVKGALEGVGFAFDALKVAIEFLTPVVDFLVQALNFVQPVLSTIAEWIGVAIGMFGNLGTAGQGLSAFIKSAWTNIQSAIQTAGNIIGTVIDWIKLAFSGAGNAVGVLKNVFSLAWMGIQDAISVAKGIIDGVISGIKGAFKGFQSVVSSVGSAVGGIIGNITSTITGLANIDISGAGAAIMDGFLGGLKSAWGAVTDFVGGIAGWIAENKGPIEYDRKLLIPAGNAIMEGLGGGLEDGFDDVQDGVLGMAGKLVRKVSSAAKHFKDTVVPQMGDWSSSLDWYAKGEIISLPSMYDVSSSNLLEHSSDGQSNSLLQKIIELLQALLDKDSDVYLDLEKVGRMTYDEHGRIMERGG